VLQLIQQQVAVRVAMLFSTSRVLGISLLLLASTSYSRAAEVPKKITPKAAVSIAEKFVVDNGYTCYPPTKPLVQSEISLPLTQAELLSGRHNSLDPKAYGVNSGNKGGPGWTVIFVHPKQAFADSCSSKRSKINDKADTGRAVTMDEYGNYVVMEHKFFFLKAVQQKL
jgi:hypothetical protein